MAKFKKGDRVRATGGDSDVPKGSIGIVTDQSMIPYIKWDNETLNFGDSIFTHQKNLELIKGTQKEEYTKLAAKVGDKFRVKKLLRCWNVEYELPDYLVGYIYEIAAGPDLDGDFLFKGGLRYVHSSCLTTEYLEPVEVEHISDISSPITTINGEEVSMAVGGINYMSEEIYNSSTNPISSIGLGLEIIQREPINKEVKTIDKMKYAFKKFVNKDLKAQVKAGLRDQCLALTGDGRDAVLEIAAEQFSKELTEVANEINEEEKD